MKSLKTVFVTLDWLLVAPVAYAALAVGADTLASLAAAELSRDAQGTVNLGLLLVGCVEVACAFLVIQASTRSYAALLVALGFGSRLLPAAPEQHLVLSAQVFAIAAAVLVGTSLLKRSRWLVAQLGAPEELEAT